MAEDGLAAIEAALVFPLLLTMLMGTFDIGNAIIANTKAIRASQVVADLVTRSASLTTNDIDEAVEAGRLAFQPLDTGSYGVDIASISFDAQSAASIVWRETRNMTPDPDVLDRVDALASANNGVMVVNIEYTFVPFFAHFITGDITMQEIAFTRGRKSAVVQRN
jgi:Flp pilus assembly protein TadG